MQTLKYPPGLEPNPNNNAAQEAFRIQAWIDANTIPENIGLFVVKDGNTWLREASLRPIPGRLFGELWYVGELCILFADTNTGKSILAVQIADSICSGIPTMNLALDEPAQPVVYFDFELTDKQFELRYSNEGANHYVFPYNFYRAQIDPEGEVPEYEQSFEDYLLSSIERAILETGAKVLVIDNLTYLKTETEKAKDAMPLMKSLLALKKRYDISILGLAHTPKRDMSKPMSKNDLQGSKMLMNFCDSSFCIGESRHDKSLRYLKHIKMRNIHAVYDDDNVILCHIQKPTNNLHFSFVNYGVEREHLAEREQKEKEKKKEQRNLEVYELHAQGFTQQQIADKLGIGIGTVNRILNGKE